MQVNNNQIENKLNFIVSYNKKIKTANEEELDAIRFDKKENKFIKKVHKLIETNSLDSVHAYKAVKIYKKLGTYEKFYDLLNYISDKKLFTASKKASRDLLKALQEKQFQTVVELIGLQIDISDEDKNNLRENLKNMLYEAASYKMYDFVLDLCLFDPMLIKDKYSKDQEMLDKLLVHCGGVKAKRGVEIAEFLIGLGATINPTSQKETPLHAACKHGSKEIIDFLLEKGAAVDAVNCKGQTPLHCAAEHGNIYAIHTLCQHGATIDYKDEYKGRTPLHFAIFASNNVDAVIEACLQNGANADEKDFAELTPLELSLKKQKLNSTLYLLSKVTKLPPEDENGLSLVHRAAQMQSIELLEVLKDRGCNLFIKDSIGRTTFHVFCLNEFASFKVLNWFLKNGFRIDDTDSEGNTALHLACTNGRQDFMKALLSCDKDLVISLLQTKNNNGLTPLHVACEAENFYAVKEIKEVEEELYKKLLSMPSDSQAIPLHYACVRGNPEVIKLVLPEDKTLLEEHLHCRASNGKTPLQIAIREKISPDGIAFLIERYKEAGILLQKDIAHELFIPLIQIDRRDLILYLVDQGIDINACTESGITPLAFALEQRYISEELIPFLITHGADFSKPMKKGIFPFHYAFESQAFRFAIQKGGDPLQKDEEGFSLLDRIIAHAKTETLEIILEEYPHLIKEDDASLVELLKPAVCAFYNMPPYLNVSRSYNKIFDDQKILKMMLKKYPQLVTAKDENGQTLLHHACKFGSFEIIRFLVSKGWSLSALDDREKSPLDLCIELNRDCFRVLTELNIMEGLKESDAYSSIFHSCIEIAQQDRSVLQPLLFLLRARNPKYYDGYKAQDEELLEFVQGIQHSQIPSDDMEHILGYALKMNNSIPLTKQTLETIEKIYDKVKDNHDLKVRFFLSLQKHESLQDIERAIEFDLQENSVGRSFDNPEEFYKAPVQRQIELLHYAHVFRMRKAIPLAMRLLKKFDESNEELMIACLKVLEKSEIPTHRFDLIKIIESDDVSVQCKIQALKTYAKINPDPTSEENKKILFDLLKKSFENEELAVSFIECLMTFTFTSEDKQYIDFHSNAKSPVVLRSCAFLLSQIPDEDALKAALSIVNTPSVWEDIERKAQNQDIDDHFGDYDMFTYRPHYHDSANSMRRIIAERLVQVHQKAIQEEIDAQYDEYVRDPKSSRFEIIHSVAKYITGIRHQDRGITYPIFFPSNRVLLRGINSKKGDALGEEALRDLLRKGAGSADLSLFSKQVDGTWAKSGQTYASTSPSYVMNGYFDKKGTLMLFDTEYLNDRMLKRDVRLQKEVGIHSVSYSTVPHFAMQHIFVPKEYETTTGNLVTRAKPLDEENTPWNHVPKKLMKLMRDSLLRRVGNSEPLCEKMTFFEEPKDQPLKKYIKTTMHEKGLYTPKIKEIIEENVKRQIARSILYSKMTDTDVQECLKTALQYDSLVL